MEYAGCVCVLTGGEYQVRAEPDGEGVLAEDAEDRRRDTSGQGEDQNRCRVLQG